MRWLDAITTPWVIGAAVGGILTTAFLWWALADLFLALPFGELLDEWRQRLTRRNGDDAANGAGATA